MTTEKDIRDIYVGLANELEAEFFDIVDEGKPTQHRVLKPGRTVEEFNTRHQKAWEDCERELVDGGFVHPPVVTDYKALYAAATSDAERVDVIARFLELNE